MGKCRSTVIGLSAMVAASCNAWPEKILPDTQHLALKGQGQVRVQTALVDAGTLTRSLPFFLDQTGKTLFLKKGGDAGGDLPIIELAKHEPRDPFGPGGRAEAVEHVSIVTQRDFAGDGHIEALIELQTPGNACGPSYVLALDVPWRQGSSVRWTTDVFAQCTYGDPKIGEGRQPSISVAGLSGETLYVYAGLASNPHAPTPKPTFRTLLAEKRVVAMPVAHLPGPQGGQGGPAEIVTDGLEATKSIAFDLDEDGKPDTIACAPARTPVCTVTLAAGEPIAALIAPSRIGVLPTKTNKMHDLVVGDKSLRWNGKDYE